MSRKKQDILVAIDIGGTFTDLAAYDPASGQLHLSKSETTPESFELGAVQCLLKAGLDASEIEFLRHGTTVVINALIERSGAKTAIVTTQGFRDILEIGRGNRPDAFNLFFERMPPLVPREHRFEVPERITAKGEILQPLDTDSLPTLVEQLESARIEAVGICLLHAYRNSVHEQMVADYLRAHTHCYICCSHEISHEFREYERTSTTAINAYVGPSTSSYLGRLTERLRKAEFDGRLFLMGSNGGILTEDEAIRRPVLLIESGPVGGAAGAAALGEQMGHRNIIALDMGGTTAKAVLIENGEAAVSSIYYVGGYERGFPVQAAVLDIVEVGAGGGSIAAINELGALEVGPRSTGAVPGPACYSKGGTAPTVTDANLLMGRLNPSQFLGGEMPLYTNLADEALKHLALELDQPVMHVAAGIVRLATLTMASAVRNITVERGYDPRDYAMVAFGGAGPLHAAAVAREIGINTVIIPPCPGHFSAYGMLNADLRYDSVQTLAQSLESVDISVLEGQFKELEAQSIRKVREIGVTIEEIKIFRYAEMRYQRQEYTVKVRLPESFGGANVRGQLRKLFEDSYRQRYGHASEGTGIDVIDLRVVVVGRTSRPPQQYHEAGDERMVVSHRQVYFDETGFLDCAIYKRNTIPRGHQVVGPAVIEEAASTTVLMSGDYACVDERGNLVIRVGRQEAFRLAQVGEKKGRQKVDPITLEIVRNLLVAIMDEAEINLSRTAFSPIIYESKDYCIGLLDAQCRTIAQSRGSVLTFMSDLGAPISDGLEIYGKDGFKPGDVLLMNYSAICGQHLNNMVVYVPVHWQGRLIGFVGSRAHWTDVGGSVSGSVSTKTTEIFQEGLQLRSVKVYKAGEPDEEILRIIRHNIRFPELSFGDMAAQIAACELGARRYLAMIEKYGWATVEECVHTIWDQAEAFARQQIRQVPDGVYVAESFLDDDGINLDKTLPIKVQVVIEGDTLTIDFSEVAKQTSGPMNSGYSGGQSAAKVAFKSAFAPSAPTNDGIFRPLRVTLPPGTIISAINNAPLSLWTVTLKTIIDTIYWALSKAMPDRIPAAHHGSMGVFTFFGEDGNSHYHTIETAIGGWGARHNGDGFSPLKTVTHGDTRIVPVEVEETFFPLLVERYEWRPDSGGPGKYRGGLGLRKVYCVPRGSNLTIAFERFKCPPWGLFGGGPAKVGMVLVQQQDEDEVQGYLKKTALELKPGARVEILSAGGGGWGPPFERDPERVLNDVRQGYVTVEGASRDYGVVIDPNSLTIDGEATGKLRQSMFEAQMEGGDLIETSNI